MSALSVGRLLKFTAGEMLVDQLDHKASVRAVEQFGSLSQQLGTVLLAPNVVDDLLKHATGLLDNQPAKTVDEWLKSLAPLEGRSLFTPEERTRLKQDQRHPRDSQTRRKAHAPA